MDCNWCIDLRLEYRFGAPYRTGRRRCLIGYGHGPLGDTRMDDPDSGLGVRALLHTLHGIHHARVPRAPLQQGEPHYPLCHLSYQLRAHQGGRHRVCRRPRFPAGVWHQGALGHRLLLDCRHRPCGHHRHLHHLRWYEIGALHLCAADPYPAAWLTHHPGAGLPCPWRMG